MSILVYHYVVNLFLLAVFNSSFLAANSALATKRSIELNETEHITVDELAQSLFFHFRAVRHGGGDANEEVVNSHLSLIREKLMNQEKKAR